MLSRLLLRSQTNTLNDCIPSLLNYFGSSPQFISGHYVGTKELFCRMFDSSMYISLGHACAIDIYFKYFTKLGYLIHQLF
jgi:hypothetical protein